MSETVLVTQPEFVKGERLFAECSNLHVIAAADVEGSLAQAVRDRDSRAVIAGVQPFHGPLYEALGETGGQRGAIISRFGVGHDSIDKSLARQHGIVVTNTPGVLDGSVAEHAMWLIGSLARHVADCHLAMKSGDWRPQCGIELGGKTLGILGFGAIGRRVAAIAHFGFGMRVIAAGRSTAEDLVHREGRSLETIRGKFGVDQYTNDVTALMHQADVLSIHLPAIDTTANFVNAERLSSMKRDALLVNTARGAVLDEDALYHALSADQLAGAALDVYQQEPYQPQSPNCDLRTLSNILLIPHTGSNTLQANEAMARASLANVSCFLQGRLGKLTRVDGT
jgi:lactate dehydrogenase-like 2-hydroxyacid dehydrogenase